MATGTIPHYIVEIQIPANANLDSYLTTGLYRSPTTQSNVETLDNCPVNLPFSMVVTGTGSLAGCVQTIMSSTYIYTRRATSSGFGSWYRFTGTAV